MQWLPYNINFTDFQKKKKKKHCNENKLLFKTQLDIQHQLHTLKYKQ